MTTKIQKILAGFQKLENQLIDYTYEQQKENEFFAIEDLSHIIKLKRKEHGITLQEFADLTGISYGTIVGIEHGKSNITLNNLISVLRALGMNLWVK